MTKIRYILFKLLCKKQIKAAWEEAEYQTRKEFFQKNLPNNHDDFIKAYEEVWLPLYNNYIKNS